MIIGDVGRDPEMRYMPNGRPVTSFNVATTRVSMDAEGERCEDTEWFNVVAWGELAETCKRTLKQGHRVYVEGRLQTRSWDTADGRKCYRIELVARDVISLVEGSEEIPFTE
jgi:single-strand DNA-binding protein